MESIKSVYRYIRILMIRCVASFFSKRKFEIPDSILIIAPHPDDEVLGCSGIIQKAIQQNKKVNIVILTGGENAYDISLIDREVLAEKRRALTIDAAYYMGLSPDNIHFLDWGDGKIIESLNNDVHHQELKLIIEKCQPDAIFTPHLYEGWSDHIYTTKIVMQIINDINERIKLYYYSVWLWYSMSYIKVFSLKWKNSFISSMNKQERENKQKAIGSYIDPLTPFGKSYSGVLPKEFLFANSWNNELFFVVK